MKLPARVEPIADDLKDFAADIGDWLKQGVARVSGHTRRELAERFFHWSQTGVADTGVKDWIGELDAAERRALAGQIEAFCAGFDLELAWLVDGELDAWPELAAAAQNLVADYCRACRAGLACQEDLARFRRRRRWAAMIEPRDASGSDPAPASAPR